MEDRHHGACILLSTWCFHRYDTDMNKTLCKHCFTRAGRTWDGWNEREWRQGRVTCPGLARFWCFRLGQYFYPYAPNWCSFQLEQVVMDRLCKSKIPGNRSPDRKTWCTMVVRRTLGCHDE